MLIIVQGYSKAIQFKVESGVNYGKFLDIRIFNFANPITLVLRKQNAKYDVILFNSNVNLRYKKMAGLCYFQTYHTHTCWHLASEWGYL